MAWDADGTLFMKAVGSTGVAQPPPVAWTFLGLADRQQTNNEVSSGTISSGTANDVFLNVGHIFPEPRDIYGIMDIIEYINGPEAYWCYYSTDTTNNIDGTWTSAKGTYSTDSSALTKWRTEIDTVSLSSVRGIRFYMDRTAGSQNRVSWYLIHYYGEISAGQTPDKLIFINEDTGLEFTGPLDWGDVPRGTILDHDIRVKNNSGSLTASDTDLTLEALTGSSNSWYTLSDSGGAFGSSLNISSIAAGATYPAANTITVRLTVADAEGLSLQAARIRMFTNSWA